MCLLCERSEQNSKVFLLFSFPFFSVCVCVSLSVCPLRSALLANTFLRPQTTSRGANWFFVFSFCARASGNGFCSERLRLFWRAPGLVLYDRVLWHRTRQGPLQRYLSSTNAPNAYVAHYENLNGPPFCFFVFCVLSSFVFDFETREPSRTRFSYCFLLLFGEPPFSFPSFFPITVAQRFLSFFFFLFASANS